MLEDSKEKRNPIWWTAIIVAVTTTILGTAFKLITGAITNSSQEVSYFPLLYLVVAFISTLLTVIFYRMVYMSLPRGWITHGLILGAFLFIAGDLPSAIITRYQLGIGAETARALTIASLLNRLINGIIMTYVYHRIAFPKDE